MATDPAPETKDKVRHYVEAAWPALTKIGLAPGALTSRLRFESNLEEALDGADFVQENVPEREGLKIKIRKEIGGHVANRLQLALYREVAPELQKKIVDGVLEEGKRCMAAQSRRFRRSVTP